jgi:catechol 2,3-dioxygenase
MPEIPERSDPQARVGHVHLKVADLERAIAFYRDALGFDVTQRLGKDAAFLCPTRRALAEALERLLDAGRSLEGAADHGVSEALSQETKGER